MYIYQYKDHLGNVRVSFTKTSTGDIKIMDTNDYYPFGMNFLKSNQVTVYDPMAIPYNYKYNELQETGMYDYGNRHYMPDIGRFNRPDRFAEKYTDTSPFSYAANNPLRYIDVKGDSIKEKVNVDFSMTPNPTRENDLGETSFSELNITGASLTNVNITVDIDINYSAAFKGSSANTNIETQNPGLQREVTAHEEGHKNQFMEAANSSVTLKLNLDGKNQTFKGPPDKVIVNAQEAFTKSKDASNMNSKDKQSFLNNNIGTPVLNKMADNINKVYTKSTKESDANKRATSTLGAGTIKYINGKNSIIFNSTTLKK